MKKIILTFVAIFAFSFMNAQSFHGGFSTGSELLKLEAGYSLDSHIHFGGYYSMGSSGIGTRYPSSYGAYGRYTFDKKNVLGNQFMEVNMRPYLGASLGLMNFEATLSTGLQNNGDSLPAESEAAYAARAGVELLYGSSSSWGTFFEIGIGNNPNIFKVGDIFSETTPKATGSIVFNVGVRFYL